MNAVFYRAFGDFKFKWDRETIESTFGAVLGDNACPPHYKVSYSKICNQKNRICIDLCGRIRIVIGYPNMDQGELKWCQKEKFRYFLFKESSRFAGNEA
jgi:hypothetical protein